MRGNVMSSTSTREHHNVAGAEERNGEQRQASEPEPVCVHIDPSPIMVDVNSPMNKVELMFVMLKLNHAFVTSMGRLVGIITRADLMQIVNRMRQQNEEEEAPSLLQ